MTNTKLSPALRAHAEACLSAIKDATDGLPRREAARKLGTSEKGLSRFLTLLSCPSPVVTWTLQELGFRVPLCPEGYKARPEDIAGKPIWRWRSTKRQLMPYKGDPDENADRVLDALFEKRPELAPLRHLTLLEAMKMIEEAQCEAEVSRV